MEKSINIYDKVYYENIFHDESNDTFLGNLSMAHYENLVLCYTHHQRDFSFHHTTKMHFGLQHTTSNKQIIFSKEEV